MSWNRYASHLIRVPAVGLSLDSSRAPFPDDFLSQWEEPSQQALDFMDQLEKGSLANPDEGRMVGHYWLRAPELAPDPELSVAIRSSIAEIRDLSERVHQGVIRGANGAFEHLLVIGIGGSALGPQFIAQALGNPVSDKLQLHFLDNTDPDGIDFTLGQLRALLGKTLCLVISKSGGTPETRNGMLETAQAYQRVGLDFARHAIAITGEDSKLDQLALQQNWLARFPMWDWVGGRTSVTGPVGLLPAALQGIDFLAFLRGAAAMDAATRSRQSSTNPALRLALMWHFLTNGRGERDMVVLPYKDRLALFSKYLQQLVMESLGKEFDLDGKVVEQGIAVYGNKGSTDQHAYVQQLRDGVPNFFVTFIQVLKDRHGPSLEVEPGITSGDYLQGFYLGTREALSEKDRPSLTITLEEVSPESVGALIALFERAVGLYAALININAYHQPGVEAGKKAATELLKFKARIATLLSEHPGQKLTMEEVAALLDPSDSIENAHQIIHHLAVNHPEKFHLSLGESPLQDLVSIAS
ncbi:MAG: glucose-6-phosphate isomerase [Puniceicoccaceae bacterium]